MIQTEGSGERKYINLPLYIEGGCELGKASSSPPQYW